MFVRLLLAFVAFGVLSAAVAGFIAFQLPPDRNPWTGVAIVVSVVLIVTIPAWYLADRFVRPIRALRIGAEQIASGDFDHRLHGGAWREARELANRFNEMSRRLVEQINHVDAERQHLRAILGGMAEGVVGIGPGQRVVFANEAAGQMLDFVPTDVVGRPLYEVIRQPAVQALIDASLASGKSQREDLELAKPAPRHLKIHVAPLAKAGDSGAVLVLNDTSELRRLERLRHEFVANVSHELKTPLSVMKTCVETLQDGAADDPNMRGLFLHQIAEGADRLYALILDLLSLARIESGNEVFDYDDVAVDESVEACIERHRPRAEAKGMTLEAIPSAPATVWADAEALGQILDNLVDNAVKYSQAGGSVRVGWRLDADVVTLFVEDNGPGIPERDLNRIFERFYRVDKARSRELGGTGLGLSIVKHLAQTMGGSVEAASQMGRGSTFTITLPRRPKAIPASNS